jgi:hypothetical protein
MPPEGSDLIFDHRHNADVSMLVNLEEILLSADLQIANYC